LKFRVGQQREINLELGLELRLILDRVAAAAEDDRIELVEMLLCVAKLGRFVRSTRRIRLGIEIEDDVLAAESDERHFLAVVRQQAELRRLVAFFEHVLSPAGCPAARAGFTLP
jgi:hypothetical protein